MNLGQARAELESRGYNRFADSRLNVWLNSAKNRFEDYPFDWPWLRGTSTGTAPLTVSDLRRVMSVVDSTNSRTLTGVAAEDLIEYHDDSLTTTGTPSFWYLSAETGLSIYPANTSASLSVRYIKFSPELSGDSDTPLIPTRYHSVWVDLAEVEALRFGVKDAGTAAALDQAVLGRLGEIAGVYAMQDDSANDSMLITGASEDW